MADPKAAPATRRAFLASAGGALLATPFLPRLAGAQVPDFPLPDLPGKKLGWAIVGLGRLAVNQILPAITDCKHSRVVALVSGRPEKAKRLAEVYGVEAKNIYDYDSYDTMARNPAIDVVYVVLPNSMHAEYTDRKSVV